MPQLRLGLVGQVPDTLGVSGENQFPLVRRDRMELLLYHLPRAWPGGNRMWIVRRPHDVLDADAIAEEIERELLLDERQMHVLVEIEAWQLGQSRELVPLPEHHVIDYVQPPGDPGQSGLDEYELEPGMPSKHPERDPHPKGLPSRERGHRHHHALLGRRVSSAEVVQTRVEADMAADGENRLFHSRKEAGASLLA